MNRELLKADFSLQKYESLSFLLEEWAGRQESKELYRFLSDGENTSGVLTYGELQKSALALSAFLRERYEPGERMLLLYPPGLDFIVAFYACLHAGLIAVPSYPPAYLRKNNPRSDAGLKRMESIALDCTPAAALTTGVMKTRMEAFKVNSRALDGADILYVDEQELDSSSGRSPHPAKREDTAFIQYTSGSTGRPRGVIISNENLLANQEMIARTFVTPPPDEFVAGGWLPLFHDMGLIGMVLNPMVYGGSCVFMTPAAFLQAPLRWLKMVDAFKIRSNPAPNFSFDLCVEAVSEEERDALDLSSWTCAMNGAEPVRRETLRRFAEYFGPSGFRRETFFPCYGLAEATLVASGVKPSGPEPEEKSEEGPASSGEPVPEMQIRIVSAETGAELPSGETGEIWLSGPSISQGYWGRETLDREKFDLRLPGSDERYMRTGDLGYMEQGRLSVTGRIKELIILDGRNFYPGDLEESVYESHELIRDNNVAAFSVEREGKEELVLICEVIRRRGDVSLDEIRKIAKRALTSAWGVEVQDVILIKTGYLPKTTSGKIQRLKCRELYLADKLTLEKD